MNYWIAALFILNVSTSAFAQGEGETVAKCSGSTHPHVNGGGTVADTAVVDEGAYVSKDSAVCDFARVHGGSQIKNSTVSENASVIDSQVNGSTLSGYVRVENSQILQSAMSESSQVYRSEVKSSILSGNSQVEEFAKIHNNSVLSGWARVSASRLDNSTLSDRAFVMTSKISNSVLAGSARVENQILNNATLN
jgi:ADP-glucose pyrophosphorylase